MVRNSGASDLARGLRVHLLRPTISKPVLDQCIVKQDGIIRSRIAVVEAMLKHGVRTKADQDEANELLSKFASGLALLERMEAKAANPCQTDLAFKSLAAAHGGKPEFGAAMTAAQIIDVQADADGRWNFKDVPNGRYCVVAVFETESFAMGWAQPVVVNSNDVKLDLFNENAAFIENK